MKNLNHDLTNARTRVRQHKMMLALRRTDLGSHIQRELPEIQLAAPFCQWEARDCRRGFHSRSASLLSALAPTETLSFATWIPCAARHPTSLTPKDLVDQFADAVSALGVTAIAGSTEVDYDANLGVWQQTVHAILRRPLGRTNAEFSADLKASLRASDDNNAPYRPVLVKPVNDVGGLISYVFKGLAILTTTQRVTWLSPEGAPQSRKQALRTPQLSQLLDQALSGDISSQLVTSFGNEVAQ